MEGRSKWKGEALGTRVGEGNHGLVGDWVVALVKARRAEMCIAQGAGAPKGRLNPGWPGRRPGQKTK